ncbi:aminotransferase class I/II-fold pyridoxal phosphate-dependent enzyme [Mucilaginibacter ginkgonis]|uniref:8-amino-7-oxononanoate synthase n=1 Tax=Mucilaginibacter ginkgonis TaxID=2682091 RepID=A0A6I4HUK3_9SPHI|nr:8-amino-7-oxononanoate synthase [Mucilaginibacter ginkgonis]QQL50403.1 8-amino-7-oxononanoate synthase [Mucilaginibacter ginkgonis]
MHPADNHLTAKLNERQTEGNLRKLRLPKEDLIDFASNDYLGFARSANLRELIDAELKKYPSTGSGSTGSRLLTGNSEYAEEIEQWIATYHGHEAALLFNSGYDANVGLFSSIARRGDTVITDELIHASIIDGIRLSNANRYTFDHNNLQSLEDKLQRAKGNIYVVVESVYSMDGDSPDISAVVALCQQYNANLIVDEAHAIGVFGKGMVSNLDLQNQVFATIVTYGKAMGVHGAAIVGSQLLRDYLINFARSFIYTTAGPLHQLVSIRMAYELLDSAGEVQNQLHQNIKTFNARFTDDQLVARSQSAIHCIKAGSNEEAKRLSKKLENAGIDVRPILSPTVAAGTERLRICLHAYNTADEIQLLADTLK